MASRRRARRKVDRSPHWRVFWAVAFCGSVAAALVASPFTVPIRARVAGAARHDEAKLRRIIGELSNTPSLLIDAEILESDLLLAPDLRSAAFRSNVFGRASLRLEYRKPVAMVEQKTAVDESGLRFQLGQRKAPNLTISTKVEDFNTIITISDASALNRLARVAKKLQVYLPKLVGTLEIDDTERISLRITDLVVEFGDMSSLDEKIQILAGALREDPERPQQGGRIILVDPDEPVQVR